MSVDAVAAQENGTGGDLIDSVTLLGTGVVELEIPGLIVVRGADVESAGSGPGCSTDVTDLDGDGDTDECDPKVCVSGAFEAVRAGAPFPVQPLVWFAIEAAGPRPSPTAVLLRQECVVTMDSGPQAGSLAYLGPPYRNLWWGDVRNEVTNYNAVLARLRAEINPGEPEVETAPPATDTFVQHPTWLWVESTVDQRSAETTSGGGTIRIRVFAEPLDANFAFGDGDQLTCQITQMRPYEGNASATSECSHIYTRSGDYTIDATLRWAYTYDISVRNTPFDAWSEGSRITFADSPVPFTTALNIDVREIQALN